MLVVDLCHMVLYGDGVLRAAFRAAAAADAGAFPDFRDGRRYFCRQRPQEAGQRDETLFKEISAAVGGKNPLEAEKALLGLEFKKLDELIGTHYFDDHALFGYALKLKLLERKTMFDQKRGKEEMDRILDGLQKKILIGERE